ncbi:hypothetical protein NWP17_16330 [Chrysosporum bergii ANA360D]|uniref:Uncharacterized protein n=1 Tax=Chrysosporum bergii ANA360D TaxID=617107 RepID=A0AA43GV84_9CYAN|nr:hypothetical protein [Chrysosporum bergii]MDH6061981.1 hypothetical protein [Chrysosporum bergii ANA360D]
MSVFEAKLEGTAEEYKLLGKAIRTARFILALAGGGCKKLNFKITLLLLDP